MRRGFWLLACLVCLALPLLYAGCAGSVQQDTPPPPDTGFQGAVALELSPELIERLDTQAIRIRIAEDGDRSFATAGHWRVNRPGQLRVLQTSGMRPALYTALVVDWQDGSVSRYPIHVDLRKHEDEA